MLLYRLGFEQANHFTQNCLESANLINPTEDQYFAAIAKAKQFPDQTITIVNAWLSQLWWVKCILRYSLAAEGVEGTTPDTEDTKIDPM